MKEKEAVVFYMSVNSGPGRLPHNVAEDKIVFIRSEIHKNTDLKGALDNAKPKDDEVVMNSHWV